MNYTEQELEISNKSYTNKDFNTIYPELLDLVTKLTNKWDPTTSNESDPGVVLLKLWSILADKNNYNIDKNILETFPLSVTQRSNAQKLYDMLGYDMHYYQSAVTDITMWYTGDAFDGTNIQNITVPKFTMVTDDSGENIFTLLETLTFSSAASPESVKAIQGTIHDYEVNGITDITLDNLDSEYRLFFTESRIAENGIFITNKGEGNDFVIDEWKRVTNLESYELNTKIYKFGVMPNTQSCYIQFPQDIGTLIGNGLNIKYIITDGLSGNVQANQLTTFQNELIPFEFEDESLNAEGATALQKELYGSSINSQVTIKNPGSTSNGLDPEDLDSAYKNYKKTIGTFNTLVTVEDYEKAIYNLKNNLGLPFASNAVVSDRTNDINYSTNVVTLVGNSTEDQLVVDTAANTDDPIMSAFDLGLYVLNPMKDIDDITGYYYNKSFSVNTNYSDIISELENQKSVCHDYIEVNKDVTGDVLDIAPNNSTRSGILPFIFKNFYTLTGKVVTYYKVTEDEAEDIEDNIKLALFKKYNARNVEFGQPVIYEELVETIQKADTRIKTLILNEPEYNLYYMKGSDVIGSIESAIPLPITSAKEINGVTPAFTKALLTDLLIKMIVGGHVQLYKFNKDVLFDFGQTQINQHKNVDFITTKSEIEIDSSNIEGSDAIGYEVKENETVQLYAPNFYAKTIYSAYVNFYFDSNKAPYLGGYKSGVYYKLDQEIQLQYTDENGAVKTPKLPINSIIRFTDSSDSNAILKINTNQIINKEIDGVTKEMGTLSASQQIELIDVNEVKFPANQNQRVLYCMWFTNKYVVDQEKKTTSYILFEENQSQKILQENEYFIYTNAERNELVILGSGTMLVRNPSWKSEISYTTDIQASSVMEDGQSAISDEDWYRYPLTETTIGGETITRNLSIVELQIISLGAGAGVKFELTYLDSQIQQTENAIETTQEYIDGELQDLINQNQQLKTDLPATIAAYTWSKLKAEIERVLTYPATAESNILKAAYDTNKTDAESENADTAETAINNIKDAYETYEAARLTNIIQNLENQNTELTNSVSSLTILLGTLEAAKDSAPNKISNDPIRIVKPYYCEEFKTDSNQNSWIALDEFELDSSSDNSYFKGWSIISRLNTSVGSAKSQILDYGESITVYSADNKTGNIIKPDNPVIISGAADKKISILSNTILAFGGGQELAVKSSNDKEIKIYSYTKVDLPTYEEKGSSTTTETKHFERGTDSYISIPITDWLRLKKIQSGRVYGDGSVSNFRRNNDTFSISFSRDFNAQAIVPITLSGKSTKAEITVLPKLNDNDLPIELSSDTDTTKYINLPKNCTGIKIKFYITVSSVLTSDAAIDILPDVLRLGYPQVQESGSDASFTPQYSNQATKTISYLYGENIDKTTYLGNLKNQIAVNYPEFDLTYNVKAEDMIDTDRGNSSYKDNLFVGEAVWDKNHICNKFTIAQWDSKNSSIKIAPTSIKK